jgi:hypothetical protein
MHAHPISYGFGTRAGERRTPAGQAFRLDAHVMAHAFGLEVDMWAWVEGYIDGRDRAAGVLEVDAIVVETLQETASVSAG